MKTKKQRTMEQKILKAIENDISYIVDDFNYSIGDPISYLIKTIISIANREQDIKIIVVKKNGIMKPKIKDLQKR